LFTELNKASDFIAVVS